MVHKIIDNFLSESAFTHIQQTIFGDTFPWYTTQGVGYEGDLSDKHFAHSLYVQAAPNSEFYPLVMAITDKLDMKALLRARVNMYLKGANLISHAKHLDFEFDHKGCILYLNTNNGYTELEDGTQVQSVANRALFFNPGAFHNSTNCTDELFRANIVINYL